MIEEPDVIDRLGNLIELLHLKEREMLARGPGPLAVLKDVKIWRNWEDYPVLEPPDKTRWQKKLDRLGKQWDLYQVAFLRRFFRRWVDQTLAGDAEKNSAVIRKIVQTVMKRKEEKQRKEAKAKRVKFVGLPVKREGTPEKKDDAKKEKKDRRKFVRKATKAIEAEKKKKRMKQAKGNEQAKIEGGEEKSLIEEKEQKEGEESQGQEKSEENKEQEQSEKKKELEKKASNVPKKHAKKKAKQKSSKKKSQQEERSRALAKEREAIIRRVSQRRHQEKKMPSLNLKYELEDDVQVSLGEITAQHSQDRPSTYTEVGQSELDGAADEQSGSERAAEEVRSDPGAKDDEDFTRNSCIEEESENETQSKPPMGEIQEAVIEEESGQEPAVEEESEIEREVEAHPEPETQFNKDPEQAADGEPEHSEGFEAPDTNKEEHTQHTDEEEDHVEHAHMADDSPEPANDTTDNESQPSTPQENRQSTSRPNIGAVVPTQEEEENTEVMSLISDEEESDMNI